MAVARVTIAGALMSMARQHHCRCLLTWPQPWGGGECYCSELVPLDQPYCRACEGRHPEEKINGVLVLSIPLGQPHPLEASSYAE